ncbi:MAG TPA: leucyl aminopeptidase [Acidimicrobiales bacterium]|nr:leucyl aminopeptidase [Acidimicrobiales bacterium]
MPATDLRATITPPLRIRAADRTPADAHLLGVPVYADLGVPAGAGGDIDTAFLRLVGFDGAVGQARVLPAAAGPAIVAVGVGPRDAVDAAVLRRAGAALARAAGTAATVATTLALGGPADAAPAVVEGFLLGAYRFEDGRRRLPDRALAELVVVGADPAAVERGRVLAEATARARTWVNTPARDMTPSRLAEEAERLAGAHGLEVEVWDEQRIAAEGLGGLGGVASGAVEPARLVRLSYRPDGAQAHVALVGKGITFDSGGLSLKTAAGMMTMKDDMGGAAAVLNATVAAAELRLPVAVTAWVAATENMPSGTAIRPGDVLTARNGTTIEVLNTDAEGRLVLADALSLAAEEKPDAIVDVATLTGAQVTALGHDVAGLMANDDALADAIVAAGQRAGEPAWRLPLVASYRRDIDSTVADIKNVSAKSPAAGTIIAGLFLQEFVGDRRWAHLDIAGPAWRDADDDHLTRGGTGWGVRTLVELLTAWA